MSDQPELKDESTRSSKWQISTTVSISSAPDEVESSYDPLMTLVDAATSVLENKEKAEKRVSLETLSSQETLKVTGSCKENCKHRSSYNANESPDSFPERLMDALDDEGNSDALVWMPDGKAFTLVDQNRNFTSKFMPKLFKIKNLSSFVRKLSRWGFHRMHDSMTQNSDIFRHPLFQRGRRDLLKQMRCSSMSSPKPLTLAATSARSHPAPLPLTPSPRSPKLTNVAPGSPQKQAVIMERPWTPPEAPRVLLPFQTVPLSKPTHPDLRAFAGPIVVAPFSPVTPVIPRENPSLLLTLAQDPSLSDSLRVQLMHAALETCHDEEVLAALSPPRPPQVMRSLPSMISPPYNNNRLPLQQEMMMRLLQEQRRAQGSQPFHPMGSGGLQFPRMP